MAERKLDKCPYSDISELLDKDELIVKTAMDTDIPYVRWLVPYKISVVLME